MKQTSFRTFAEEVRGEINRKGSKFIAVGAGVTGKDELEEIREDLWEEFPKASHVASGSILLESGRPVERYDNDGEPSGTAGEPILQVIKGENLANSAVFVVRYFGGTELGTGGLSRAYSDAARKVIDKGDIVLKRETGRYLLKFPYSLTGEVVDILAKYDEIKILERNYGENPELVVSVPVDSAESFSEQLRSGTAGEVGLEKPDNSNEGGNKRDSDA